MSEERMTVATVDICSCGLVMHQLDADDYDTLGADSGICCSACGNEIFTTIEQLQSDLATAKKENRQLRKLPRNILQIQKLWASTMNPDYKKMAESMITIAEQALEGSEGE